MAGTDLKPCPFCGSGDVNMLRMPYVKNALKNGYAFQCRDCGATVGIMFGTSVFTDYATEEEAANGWNTRAERTCEEFGSVRVWQECNVWSHELSCGHEVDTLDMEPPNYCPNCGARVTTKYSETTPKVVGE